MIRDYQTIHRTWFPKGRQRIIAQLALGYGANDLDGTATEEKISHSAGAKTMQNSTKETLLCLIRQAGKIPVERDSTYNILKIHNP